MSGEVDYISSGQLLLDGLLDGLWTSQKLRLRIVTGDSCRFSRRRRQIVEIRILLAIERWITDAEYCFGFGCSRAIFRCCCVTYEHVQARRGKQREVTDQISL